MEHVFSDDELLVQEQAAALLKLDPSTLARWRCSGSDGPRYVKLGSGRQAPVRYWRSDVLQFAKERCVEPARAAR